jgi:glycosyltransferase involved in cell wall biosynthesis
VIEIAVVIPTHNRAQLVCDAIESVLAQTSMPDEIVVVDDGSTDDTSSLLAQRYTDRPPVRVVTQENRGVSAARNRGIEETRSPWLAFLDSDDRWHENKLACQIEALSRARDAGQCFRICHSNEVWIRAGNQVQPRDRHRKAAGFCFEHCLESCAISPSTVLLERSLLAEVGVFDETLMACEDYDLWLRVSRVEPVLLVEDALVTKYGGHDDQLSRRFVAMDRFRIQALERLLAEMDLDHNQAQAARHELSRKLEIYGGGCLRRGKLDQVEWCRQVAERVL